MQKKPKADTASHSPVQYQLFFDKLPSATFVCDLDGHIQYVNLAAEQLFNVTAKKLRQTPLIELLKQHLLQPELDNWQALLDHRRLGQSYVFRGKNGALLQTHCNITIDASNHFSIVMLHQFTPTTPAPPMVETPENNKFAEQSFAKQPDKPLSKKEHRSLKTMAPTAYFQHLFQDAPIALIEVDYSRVFAHLTQNRAKFDTDPGEYLIQHPQELQQILELRIITAVNKAAYRLFKIDSIKAFRKVLPKLQDQATIKRITNVIINLLNGKTSLEHEAQITDAQGHLLTAHIRFSVNAAERTRALVAFHDISNIKKIQAMLKEDVKIHTRELEKANMELHMEIESREQIAKDLRQSEARYRQLNAIYPGGIFHTDKDGNNTYCNSKACELSGVAAGDALGDGWTKNLHPDDRDFVIFSWKNAVKYGIPLNIDYRFLNNGRVTWVNVQSVPEYDEYGNIVGYVGILVDITKQRAAEEQIKQNQIEIAHFSRVNSISEVASGIAHELNQPLTAIINYASGCKRRLQDLPQDIPAEILDAIENTISQAERAGKVIHHLKDFLRKGELSKKGFDLNSAIQDVLTFIDKLLIKNNTKINLKLDPTLPVIYADKVHIEQVILNIVNNAIEAFIGANSQQREITICTEMNQENQVQISINDTGPGIDASFIENIFNPFITSKEHGMGIGLSLCYNIIDKHKGRIWVESELGKGAIFYITLPVK